MRKIKCCYECTERHIGCHATCERYVAERKATDYVKDENSIYNYYRDKNIKLKHKLARRGMVHHAKDKN